jgi:hypothetical protein
MKTTQQILRSMSPEYLGVLKRMTGTATQQARMADVGNANATSRTADITWTTGAAVSRISPGTGDSWIEELSCDPSAVRMGRLRSGAPLLDTHNRYSVAGVLGVVESAKMHGDKGTATVRFSKRAEVDPIFQDVKDKIIRNVSVGYTVYRYDDVSTADDLRAGTRRLRAMDWEPSEISLVPVGADANAGVRGGLPLGYRAVALDATQPVKPATAAELSDLRRRFQELQEKKGL